MKFLKFISAVALAFLLYFMLGNIVTYLFPPVATESTAESCSERYPYPKRAGFESQDAFTAADKQAATDREACQKSANQVLGDQLALDFQSALLRAVVVFVALVIFAIFLYRRFPFLAGSLIFGGLLFTLIYPFTAQLGGLLDSAGTGFGDLTDVQKQVQLTKFIIEAVAFGALVLADVLFFERHREPAPIRPLESLHHSPPTPPPGPPHLPPAPPRA